MASARRVAEEVTLGVDEWAAVAWQALVLGGVVQPQIGTGTPAASSYREDFPHANDGPYRHTPMKAARAVRDVLNLMMTCRQLYHNLPYALPKWCCSVVLSSTSQSTWLDTFQCSIFGVPALTSDTAYSGRLEQQDDDDDDDDEQQQQQPQQQEYIDGVSHASCHDGKSSSTAAGLAAKDDCVIISATAWLEDRFLVYSWLGVVWNGECAFLRTCNRTREFRESFAGCGRLSFHSLDGMEAWLADNDEDIRASTPSRVQSTSLSDDEKGGHASAPDQTPTNPTAATTTTATAAANVVTSQRRTREATLDKKETGLAQHAHQRGHSPHSQRVTHHTETAGPGAGGCSLCPARLSVALTRTCQEDLEAFHRMRARMGSPRGRNFYFHVTGGIEEMHLADVDDVCVACRDTRHVIARCSFTNVSKLLWILAADQCTLDARFHHVRSVKLLGQGNTITDVSALDGVADVSLRALSGMDLSPLRCAQRVSLTRVGADLTPLRDVPCLNLSGYTAHSLRSKVGQHITLNATQLVLLVQPTRLPTATATATTTTTTPPPKLHLHLPRAARFAVECNELHSIDCMPSVDIACLTNCTALEELPPFAHANKVVINTRLTREVVAALSARVNLLVLQGDATRDLSALSAVAAGTRVQLHDVQAADIKDTLPSFVQRVGLSVRGRLRTNVAMLEHVRYLTVNAAIVNGTRHMSTLIGLERLRHLRHVTLRHQHIEAVFSSCEQVHLYNCAGTVRVRDTDTFVCAYAPNITVEELSCVGAVRFEGPGPMTLAGPVISDVNSMQVHSRRLSDLSLFAGVRRLALQRCTFDSVDSLPAVQTLVISDCRDSSHVLWPSVTLVNRTKDEIKRALTGQRASSV